MSTYEAASQLAFFEDGIDELAKALFLRDLGLSTDAGLSDDDRRKIAWVSSLLASSRSEEHQRRALAAAILLYIRSRENGHEGVRYDKLLYVVLSRLGSLPTAKAMNELRSPSEFSITRDQDSLLDGELESTESFYRLDDDTILTDFQRRVWSHLSAQHLVFSGPTSSGKSFLVRLYIRSLIRENDSFQGLYIVPSRALISEVSTNFRKEVGDMVRVETDAHLDENPGEFLLVVTPERCLQLFDHTDLDINLTLVFFDELQQLEDSSRGPLFEDVLQSLKREWPSAQILAAGPNLDRPSRALQGVLGVSADEVQTIFDPILQLESRFTFHKYANEIDVQLKSPTGNILDLSIDQPTGLTFSKIQQNKKQSVKRFMEEFGGDDQTLIYAKKKHMAEDMALGVAETKEEREKPFGIVSFLEDAIHPEYSLVRCLKKGVSFHHAGIPQVARNEVERLYKEGELMSIISTPTLLQGVNLPAGQMLIVDASKGRQELTDFELRNLIGRVGRIGSRLYGTIYYLDSEEDEWSEERLRSEGTKSVTSATTKTIADNLDRLEEAVTSERSWLIEQDAVRYTSVLLRQRFYKDNYSVKDYLEKKNVTGTRAQAFVDRMRATLPELQIPKEILRKNPTIDPLLQNDLYRRVSHQHRPWEIDQRRLKNSFFDVTRKLNQIFHFAKDEDYSIEEPPSDETDSRSINELLYTGYYWLRGRKYSFMIERRKEIFDDHTIDRVIRDIMGIVNTDIRFVVVKYYKVLCDVLSSLPGYDNNVMMNMDQRIERGTIDPIKLLLMDMGVDRSVALDIDTPSISNREEMKIYLESAADEMPGFIERHLEEKGVI